MTEEEEIEIQKQLEAKFDELFGKIDVDEYLSEPLEIEEANSFALDEADEGDIDNIITMTDEDGNDVKFDFLDLIEYEGKEYIILLPTEHDEDGGEVVILRVDEELDDGMDSYSSVEDEQTLNAVFEIFKEKFRDEFNFVD